jgi:hypothetical protein
VLSDAVNFAKIAIAASDGVKVRIAASFGSIAATYGEKGRTK